MKAYAVILDWSTSDDSHVDIELFDTFAKAFHRFNEIIENEKKPEISWVADAFDENGEISDGYESERNERISPRRLFLQRTVRSDDAKLGTHPR